MSKRYYSNIKVNAYGQALINAHNYSGDDSATIRKNVIGAAFFGTPHRGAGLANILNAVLKISFSSKQFVCDLSPTSQVLKELNDLFRDRVTELQLISFWESTGIRAINVLFTISHF